MKFVEKVSSVEESEGLATTHADWLLLVAVPGWRFMAKLKRLNFDMASSYAQLIA
jgi:hypothetical protein